MKRAWLYIAGLVLAAAAGAGIVTAIQSFKDHGDKGPSFKTKNNSSRITSTKEQACAIFTLADAKQVLGDSAKGGASNGETFSDDLAVSTCAYAQTSGNNLPEGAGKLASLLVRSPKTEAGLTSNQAQFGPAKPADSLAVAGYGDSAYWDPQYGQLDILKNNTWYTLSSGPKNPSARGLDQTKQLADILISKM